eukprot:6350034-Pyramimonas_sp.AAC.1
MEPRRPLLERCRWLRSIGDPAQRHGCFGARRASIRLPADGPGIGSFTRSRVASEDTLGRSG